MLASGSEDNCIIVWALNDDITATPTVLWKLTGHTRLVRNVKFSPDGSKIASASWDGKMIIWNAESGGKVMTCEGKEDDDVHCVSWSSDSRLVATGGFEGTVRVWDAEAGTQVT